jgi:hypothetical protein
MKRLIVGLLALWLACAPVVAPAADKTPLANYGGGAITMKAGDTVPVANGGTGATTAAAARTNLGITAGITTTGTPASGNLTKFSGSTSVTNGDLSGDCSTSGTLSLTCSLPVGHIASVSANTVVGNGTGSSASPSALSMPSCSASSSALTWTSASGFGCNTISGATISGTPTTGNCASWASSTALQDAGAACGGGGGGGAPGASYSTPTLASFTWLNQQSATATQTVSGQAIALNTTNTSQVSALGLSPPSCPYRLRAQLVGYSKGGGSPSQFGGIGFYDGTKLSVLGSWGATASMIVGHLSTVTANTGTWGGGVSSWASASFMLMPSAWVQIRNDCTTLYYDQSMSGQNFTNQYSEAIGTFISTPTKVLFAGAGASGSGGVVELLNWSVSSTSSLN